MMRALAFPIVLLVCLASLVVVWILNAPDEDDDDEERFDAEGLHGERRE